MYKDILLNTKHINDRYIYKYIIIYINIYKMIKCIKCIKCINLCEYE